MNKTPAGRPSFRLRGSGTRYPAPFVHKGLQDESRRHLVHNCAMTAAFTPSLVENLVSLAGRQPLIPEMYRQPGQFPKLARKLPGLQRARAHVPGKMKRIADHDSRDLETSRQASQRAQILARIPASLQGEDGLRRHAQFVGHRNPDAAGADIKAEITRGWRGGQN